MDNRRLESIRGYTPERAHELAGRAGAYVQERARDVGDRVESLTGRSMESLTRDASQYVRQHPLQAIALTIALGFLLGKILSRD